MEKYDENHPAVKYLTESGPVSYCFFPKHEELVYGEIDLADASMEAANKVIDPEVARFIEYALLNYIYAPAMIDHFVEDTDRDAYENVLLNENLKAGELLKKNRLGMQNIKKVMNTYNILQQKHEFLQKENLVKKSEEILRRFLPYGLGTPSISEIVEGNYDRISIADKIIISDKVAEFARDVCVEIIKQAKINS